MFLTKFAREFAAMQFSNDDLGQVFWGRKTAIIVMTDNRAVTRLSHAKQIPPKLWISCDKALQLNCTAAHIPNFENPAADYLCRSDIAPTDRICRILITQCRSSTSKLICHHKLPNKMTTKRNSILL